MTALKRLWDCAFHPGLVSGITDSWMVTDVIALPLARARGAEGPAEGLPEEAGARAIH